MAYFKILFRLPKGDTDNSHENISQDRQWNPGFKPAESRMLVTGVTAQFYSGIFVTSLHWTAAAVDSKKNVSESNRKMPPIRLEITDLKINDFCTSQTILFRFNVLGNSIVYTKFILLRH